MRFKNIEEEGEAEDEFMYANGRFHCVQKP